MTIKDPKEWLNGRKRLCPVGVFDIGKCLAVEHSAALCALGMQAERYEMRIKELQKVIRKADDEFHFCNEFDNCPDCPFSDDDGRCREDDYLGVDV